MASSASALRASASSKRAPRLIGGDDCPGTRDRRLTVLQAVERGGFAVGLRRGRAGRLGRADRDRARPRADRRAGRDPGGRRVACNQIEAARAVVRGFEIRGASGIGGGIAIEGPDAMARLPATTESDRATTSASTSAAAPLPASTQPHPRPHRGRPAARHRRGLHRPEQRHLGERLRRWLRRLVRRRLDRQLRRRTRSSPTTRSSGTSRAPARPPRSHAPPPRCIVNSILWGQSELPRCEAAISDVGPSVHRAARRGQLLHGSAARCGRRAPQRLAVHRHGRPAQHRGGRGANQRHRWGRTAERQWDRRGSGRVLSRESRVESSDQIFAAPRSELSTLDSRLSTSFSHGRIAPNARKKFPPSTFSIRPLLPPRVEHLLDQHRVRSRAVRRSARRSDRAVEVAADRDEVVAGDFDDVLHVLEHRARGAGCRGSSSRR